MTALLLENIKLIMLFMLIGAIIGLSHAGSGRPIAGAPETASQIPPACIGAPLTERKMSVIAHRKNAAIASPVSAIAGFLAQGDQERRKAAHAHRRRLRRSADAQGGDRGRALSQPIQALVEERRRFADCPLSATMLKSLQGSDSPGPQRQPATCSAAAARLRGHAATQHTERPAAAKPAATCPISSARQFRCFSSARTTTDSGLHAMPTDGFGGIFLLKHSALRFADRTTQPGGCATMFLSERFELDIENQGNPLVVRLGAASRLVFRLAQRLTASARRASITSFSRALIVIAIFVAIVVANDSAPVRNLDSPLRFAESNLMSLVIKETCHEKCRASLSRTKFANSALPDR